MYVRTTTRTRSRSCANSRAAASPALTLAAAGGPVALAIADLNTEGQVDIASADYDTNTISVRLRNPTGFSSTSYPVAAGPFSIAVADLNGDTKPDLVSGNLDSASVSVLSQQPGGGYSASSYAADAGIDAPVEALAVADLSGDGRPDLTLAIGGAIQPVLINISGNPTSISVSSNHNPAFPGQSVAYSGTLSPATGLGSVAFGDNGALIPGCESKPLDAGGHASCQTSYPSAGTHTISAR